MKKFNVALLSDDTLCKTNYFFIVDSNSEGEAIERCREKLREILISQYSGDSDDEEIETELNDYTPLVFEFTQL
jgi:hypothetical protein